MRECLLWGATGQSKVLHEALLGGDIQIVAVGDQREVTPPFADIPLLLGAGRTSSVSHSLSTNRTLRAKSSGGLIMMHLQMAVR